MDSEGDKVMKVKVKFANETVIRPNESTDDASNISDSQESADDSNMITVDLEKETNSNFSNGYEVSEGDSTDELSQTPKVEGVTRTGRNIIKPSRCRNYTLLLAGLINSQFVSNVDNEFAINQNKQISFFQAQLDHKVATNKLPDGTNNAFEPLLFQAQESSNVV